MTRSMRVLVVEDNPADADLIVDVLNSSEKPLSVATVFDGAAAMSYLFKLPPYEEASRPDVILLDLNLPKLSGPDVLRSLRSDDAFRAIPVIIFTSSEAPSDIRQSYEGGANCYVTKPMRLSEYRNVLRAVEHFWTEVSRVPA